MKTVLLASILGLAMACLLTGCSDRTSVAGKYRSMDVEGVVLQLEADGRGTLTSPEDVSDLRWEVAGKRIVVHTRDGGAIAGTLTEEGLVLALLGETGAFVKDAE